MGAQDGPSHSLRPYVAHAGGQALGPHARPPGMRAPQNALESGLNIDRLIETS